MISKSCKYAIRATLFLSSKAKDNVKIGVKEIAEEIEAPAPFTAKILQILSKGGVVTSVKGPYGGFYCSPDQLDLPLIEIVSAVDGLGLFKECVMGLHKCSDEHPCPMHHNYAGIRNRLLEVFTNTSIGSLADDLSAGNAFLKNPDIF